MGMGAPSVDPLTGELSGGGALATIGMGLLALFWLGTIIPAIAVSVRRMHDQDRSGWWILVPIANIIFLFIDGTRGPNRFGPDPKDPRASRRLQLNGASERAGRTSGAARAGQQDREMLRVAGLPGWLRDAGLRRWSG